MKQKRLTQTDKERLCYFATQLREGKWVDVAVSRPVWDWIKKYRRERLYIFKSDTPEDVKKMFSRLATVVDQIIEYGFGPWHYYVSDVQHTIKLPKSNVVVIPESDNDMQYLTEEYRDFWEFRNVRRM